MQTIEINQTNHEWEKINLVTLQDSKGRYYDKVICSRCKLKGKRYNFTEVEVHDNTKVKTLKYCPNALPFVVPEKIKITYCRATGIAWGNCSPGSVHNVIDPPEGYTNDHTGVWIMGNGEPVKILATEFNEIK